MLRPMTLLSPSEETRPEAATMRLFCFGLGFTAAAVAAAVRGATARVAGTARSKEAASALAAQGFEAFAFDGAAPMMNAPQVLAGATHVLISVPPDAEGDPVLRCHGGDLVRLLSAAPPLRWVGYLSTTAVYGDRGGEWVDEETPCAPTTARAERRLAAETAWLDLHRERGLPVHIFRLAGIYGPGRNAIVEARRGAARRIHKPGQVFSRIHVEDIAQVVLASMARSNPGRVYNVCDNEPAPGEDVVAHAFQLIGQKPPAAVPFDDAAAGLSEMARSFYADNKRVRNDRIKRELGVILRYPNYRIGLEALLAAGE